MGKEIIRKFKLSRIFIQLCSALALAGCCVHGRDPFDSTLTFSQFVTARVHGHVCDLEMKASMEHELEPAGNVCLIVLKNLTAIPIQLPDSDLDGHLSVDVYLTDSHDRLVGMTPIGNRQFGNFQGLFVGTRTMGPGETWNWRVDLPNSFNLAPREQYLVHVSYSCYDPSKCPDFEVSGLRFQREKDE